MRTKHASTRLNSQRGAAALILAALMVVFCATLAGSYYVGSQSASSATSYEQVESLRWAQEAITGFATAQGRLPCPASVRDGAENCAPGIAKGWLPVASIEQFVHPLSARGRMQIRYLVYRGADGGADPDLAVATDSFQPTGADGSVPKSYPALVSSADLCGQLHAASLPDAASRWTPGHGPSGSSARADRANVPLATGGGSMNVAYALAVSPVGTADDNSGLNAAAGPHFESPYRTGNGSYRDIVRAVEFGVLYDTLACGMTTASLDGLAVAASWTTDSVGAREGAIEATKKVVEIEALIVTGSGLLAIGSGLDLKNAMTSLSVATTTIAVNTPLEPWPPAVAAVVSGTAGAVTATATIASAKVDLGKSVVGAGVEAGSLVEYRVAEAKATNSHVWKDSIAILTAADTMGISP
ncbi:MAG: hypothetical protein ACRYGA_14360 [Janthinobacterium lividum]